MEIDPHSKDDPNFEGLGWFWGLLSLVKLLSYDTLTMIIDSSDYIWQLNASDPAC